MENQSTPMRRRYTQVNPRVFANYEHPRCCVPGCLRRPHHFGAVRCGRHESRATAYGDARASAVTEGDLRPYFDYIAQGLSWFHATPALHEAERRTEYLLHYTPTEDAEWSRWLAGRMTAARCKRGRSRITPFDVLIRVLAFYALQEAHPERVPSITSHRILLARVVGRLGPSGGRRVRIGKHGLIRAGEFIAELYGPFPTAFLAQLRKRWVRERTRKERGTRLLADFGSAVEIGATNTSETNHDGTH